MILRKHTPTLGQIRTQLWAQLREAIDNGHRATDTVSRAYWAGREVQLSRLLDKTA